MYISRRNDFVNIMSDSNYLVMYKVARQKFSMRQCARSIFLDNS